MDRLVEASLTDLLTCRPIFNDTVYRVTSVGMESIVYPIDDREGAGIVVLNASAASILNAVIFDVKIAHLVDLYAHWFCISPSQASSDICECLESFISVGVISCD